MKTSISITAAIVAVASSMAIMPSATAQQKPTIVFMMVDNLGWVRSASTSASSGARVPQDRRIDGVDQLDFLTGKSDKSAREGFPVYNGDDLFAYKWRNWKIHFVDQDTMLGKVERGVMFKIYHLFRDPKEQYNLLANNVSDAAWVVPPVLERVMKFRKSLVEEPPIKLGTPDPYVPPKLGRIDSTVSTASKRNEVMAGLSRAPSPRPAGSKSLRGRNRR